MPNTEKTDYPENYYGAGSKGIGTNWAQFFDNRTMWDRKNISFEVRLTETRCMIET